MVDAFERKLAGVLGDMYPASALPMLHPAMQGGHGRLWSHGWTFIMLGLALSGLLLPMSQEGVYLFIGDLGINLSSWALLATSLAAALAMLPLVRIHASRDYA